MHAACTQMHTYVHMCETSEAGLCPLQYSPHPKQTSRLLRAPGGPGSHSESRGRTPPGNTSPLVPGPPLGPGRANCSFSAGIRRWNGQRTSSGRCDHAVPTQTPACPVRLTALTAQACHVPKDAGWGFAAQMQLGVDSSSSTADAPHGKLFLLLPWLLHVAARAPLEPHRTSGLPSLAQI